jgi:hypothetical protein
MNRLLRFTLAAAVCVITATAQAQTQPAGYVDFGKLSDGGDGDSVEINIKGALLAFAAKVAEKSEPKASELLKNLKQVRVNVLKLTEKNREEIAERAKAIRAQLVTDKWEQIVSVQEKKEDVGVYVKMSSDEAIQGLVVTVIDGSKEAVFVNIVGDIRADQLAEVADQLDIGPLKKMTGKFKKEKS